MRLELWLVYGKCQIKAHELYDKILSQHFAKKKIGLKIKEKSIAFKDNCKRYFSLNIMDCFVRMLVFTCLLNFVLFYPCNKFVHVYKSFVHRKR